MINCNFRNCYFSIFLMLFIPTGTAFCNTIIVPSQAPNIQSGLDMSAVGDTVMILAGEYFEYDLIMKAGVVLSGVAGHPDSVTVNAQSLGRILDCDNLDTLARVENISFTGGHVTDGWFSALGGAIRCQSSKLSINNCVFIDNTARIGAALGFSLSEISILNCVFENNNATHDDWAAGGALWARDCTGSINNCQVLSNTAFSTNPGNPGDGGGFFFNNNRLAVSECLFQGNSTGAGAGAMYSVTNDSSVFQACEFLGNFAANGGAVYYEYGAAARFSDCTFTGNAATAGGAIVSFNESFPFVENCLFSDNQAQQWGGGAFDCWNSEAEIRDCLFLDNTAQSHGGAINAGGSSIYLTGNVFSGNQALGRGGAVRAHYANLFVSECTIVGNSAPDGGGIHCGTSSTAHIDHTIIAFSNLGASTAGFEEGYATISCCDFFGNAGGDWVGLIADQIDTDNNISENPDFCDLEGNNFTLSNTSPCAMSDENPCGMIGALGVACAPSVVEHFPDPEALIVEVRNYPNPFNPTTTIEFTLSEEAHTELIIYDLAGYSVRTLHRGTLPGSTHRLEWDGINDEGMAVASGVYFYVVKSGDNQSIGRMALLK